MADPYQILQVSPQATQAEIKQAYRRLAKEIHPDSQTQMASHEAIVQLNAAYEALSDRHRRQAVDQQRESQVNRRQQRDRRAQSQYVHQRQGQTEDPVFQFQKWLKQVYQPVNRQINKICKPLKRQINDLSADPFDSDLMETFVDYVADCRDRLTQAQTSFRKLPNPSIAAATAASLYYALNHLEDGINELEWFTNNYDDHCLHTGTEFFRLAQRLQREAKSKLPDLD